MKELPSHSVIASNGITPPECKSMEKERRLTSETDPDSDSSALQGQLQSARFPEKAFFIITQCDSKEPEIAEWNETGDAMIIKDKASMEKKYLSTSFESFVRQLHMYGFKKVNDKRNGSNKGGKKDLIFRHDCFKRGHPELLDKMQTVKSEERAKALRKQKKQQDSTHKPTNTPSITMNKSPLVTTNPATSGTDLMVVKSLHKRLDRMEGKVDDLKLQMDEMSVKFDSLLHLIAAPTPTVVPPNCNNKRVRTDEHASESLVERIFGRRVSSSCKEVQHMDTDSRHVSNVPSEHHRHKNSCSSSETISSFSENERQKDQQTVFYDINSGKPYNDVFDNDPEGGLSHGGVSANHSEVFTDDQLAQIAALEMDSALSDAPSGNHGPGGRLKSAANNNRRKSYMVFTAMALMAVVGAVAGSLITSSRHKSSPQQPEPPQTGGGGPSPHPPNNQRNITSLIPTLAPTLLEVPLQSSVTSPRSETNQKTSIPTSMPVGTAGGDGS